MQVLVAYASKYGATAAIAERIGDVLREAGLEADVMPADRVDDPAPYRAVVLGSAVYMGRWRKPAAKFLAAHEQALSNRPVWLFSSGPTEAGDPVELLQGWTFPAQLQPIADRIGPIDVAVFHGAVDPAEVGAVDRWILGKVKAPTGDFRDWESITGWAARIAAHLLDDPQPRDSCRAHS